MNSSLTSQHLVRLLADENRRRVVAALVLSDAPASAEQMAQATGLALRAVVDSADRLINGGLVEGDTNGYSLIDELFQQVARAEAPDTPQSAHPHQPEDIARVLDLAFKNGKLVQWPAKRTKRLVVLDHLAQNFDIGKRYKEAEINDLLKAFTDDVATMCRYLVDAQFLDRGNGEYWRCGGSF
jgi:hypothetical protein